MLRFHKPCRLAVPFLWTDPHCAHTAQPGVQWQQHRAMTDAQYTVSFRTGLGMRLLCEWVCSVSISQDLIWGQQIILIWDGLGDIVLAWWSHDITWWSHDITRCYTACTYLHTCCECTIHHSFQYHNMTHTVCNHVCGGEKIMDVEKCKGEDVWSVGGEGGGGEVGRYVGKWKGGEIGKWGDREVGRWGRGEVGEWRKKM